MNCLYKLTPNSGGWTLARESGAPLHFGTQWDALLHVFGQPCAACLAIMAEDGTLDHYLEHSPQQPSR